MRTPSVSRWFGVLLLLICLGFTAGREAQGGDSPGQPPRPELLNPQLAPQAARLLRQVALSYEPNLTPRERDRDFLQKVTLVKNSLDLTRLVDLRHQSLDLLSGREEVSWEDLRLMKWPNRDRVGVRLSAPVWVPAGAKRIPAYCAFEKHWRTVAENTPRPCGYIWHAPTMAAINNKDRYRPERIQFEVNSKFAPLAAMLLEYIFREGWYKPAKRVPLLVVRGGEDTYSVSSRSGPVVVECLNFPENEGTSLNPTVAQCLYHNLSEVYHGRHAVVSNHRLGLALDINDFNFAGVVDGSPNPISPALRQYNRNAMHRLDARNLPPWVYTAAKWLGCRLPQEWSYVGYATDWPHVDVGTK